MMEKIPFCDDTIPSLIKSNTLIKVPCLTDWCVTKFLLTFESTKVQTPESIWAYLTMRFWRWGHRDIDTLRVVNQDVKREIFQNNLSRSILTVPDNSNKHSIYVKAGRNILSWIKMNYTKGNSIFKSNMKSLNFPPPSFEIFNNNLHNRL